MPISILMSKIIFKKYLPPVTPKLVPELKMIRIYWNLAHLIFRISRSQFWCQKLIFKKYLPPAKPKLIPKLKVLRIFLKFGIFDISNIPTSILMSKVIFMKYLPSVRPKLVPKLKMLRICWNLARLIFRISRSRFWCQNWYQGWHIWNIEYAKFQ